VLDKAGATDRAEAAYRRADERGHRAAEGRLGMLLERRGERTEARAAYERPDRRGDAISALNLGILLEDLGDRGGARAAYRRARRRGVPRAALPASRSRRRRLALAATLAIAALGAGIAGLELTNTRRSGQVAAARTPGAAPSVAGATTAQRLRSPPSQQSRRLAAHRMKRHAVRHRSATRSQVPAPAARRTTVSASTHVALPPIAGTGGGPNRSSSASHTSSPGGGGIPHTTHSTGSNQPGGTGTVSGGVG
jgi:hypothetical protein